MNGDAVSEPAVAHTGISPHRIGAMVQRYWYLLMSSWPRLLELIYWPALQIITWGFLQNFISENAGFFARAGGTLIGAVILWDILFRGQLGFSISFLEEMWARNLANLVWTLMFGILPLACIYYPVTVLPHWLQYVAWSLPPTYVFEGMRALLSNHMFRADLMIEAFAINVVLFAASFAIFLALLRSARRHGALLQGGE
jgi:ABC-2 type transport system permease protein